MPSSDFSVGDIVRLRCDTVRKVVCEVKDGRVYCEWHNCNDDALESDYDPRVLAMVRKAEQQ